MSKSVVFYFSATGNSLAAARQIAQAIEADCVAIRDASIIENDYDRIGFVFPTFSWGMPQQVQDFVTRMEIVGKPEIFAVATCGVLTGNALWDLKTILQKKGQTLHYGKSLVCAANNIFLYDLKEERVQKGVTSQEQGMKQIAGEIMAGLAHPVNRPVLAPVFAKLHEKQVNTYAESDVKFTVAGNCTGCGLCAKVCPAQNIVISQGKPEFHHRCQHCIACVQWCPIQAIDWDGKTAGRRRYHHPQVNADAMSGWKKAE